MTHSNHQPSGHTAHHGHSSGSAAGLTTAATLHCLTGCAIGEWMGLAIGVSLGFPVTLTLALATVMGFMSGYSLSLLPLVRRQGMSLAQAFRVIWLGETLSIGAMELAMNFADYHFGGVRTASMLEPRFWMGYGVALIAGFIVAWPVNYAILRGNIKRQCH